MEGNLRFKINWASLTVGRKLPFLLRFTLHLRAISKNKPPQGAYFRNFMVYNAVVTYFCSQGGHSIEIQPFHSKSHSGFFGNLSVI